MRHPNLTLRLTLFCISDSCENKRFFRTDGVWHICPTEQHQVAHCYFCSNKKEEEKARFLHERPSFSCKSASVLVGILISKTL